MLRALPVPSTRTAARTNSSGRPEGAAAERVPPSGRTSEEMERVCITVVRSPASRRRTAREQVPLAVTSARTAPLSTVTPRMAQSSEPLASLGGVTGGLTEPPPKLPELL